MKNYLDLEKETWELYDKVLPKIKNKLVEIDAICEENTAKVLQAF